MGPTMPTTVTVIAPATCAGPSRTTQVEAM